MRKSYIYWIAVAKICAACAVILLHSTVPVVFSRDALGFTADWWIATFLNSGSRFAVPLFVMLSGAIFLPRTNASQQPKQFISTRLHRLLAPTIFWILAYAIFHHFIRGDSLTPLFLIRNIIFNEQYEHLYFLFLIGQLWLLTPILRKKIFGTNLRKMVVVCSIWAVVSLLWQPRLFIGTLWIPYVFYYLLGGLVNQVTVLPKLHILSFFNWVALALITTLATFLLTKQGVSDNLYFFRYNSITTMGSTISIALVFIGLKDRLSELSRKQKSTITQLASLTFGVYLISPMISTILSVGTHALWGGLHNQQSILTVFLLFTCTILLSFSVVYILKRIPLVKKIV